jgi:hypothetical protein
LTSIFPEPGVMRMRATAVLRRPVAINSWDMRRKERDE